MTTTAPEFANLREKIAWEKQQRTERYEAFEALFAEAHATGLAAGRTTTPTTMVVGSPTTPLGNDIDPTKPVYVEPEGPCGFGWVRVGPATCSFGRWLIKTERGRTSYPRGIMIWIGAHGQSYERKIAHAQAMADVLKASPLLEGVTIYAGGRLD